MTIISIGTKFATRHKVPKICTVVDILTTYNSKNEIVKTSYLCEHELNGQIIKSEECKTTIMMGMEKAGVTK